MRYAVVFLDMFYSNDYYLNRIRNIGDMCFMSLNCTGDFNEMRKTIEFAFEQSDGLFIVYPNKLWHKLQKVMLVSFERPSVFKEEAYIVASGFEKLSEGIFAGLVYKKPVVFIHQQLNDDFDFSVLKKMFNTKNRLIGIFEESIDNPNKVCSDEVLSYIRVENTEVIDPNIKKSKIFTYSGLDCNQVLVEALEKASIKLSFIDLSTNGYLTNKLMLQEKSKNYITFCIDNASIETLSYFLNDKLLEKYGYFSQTIAKELSSNLLNFSNSDCSLVILNNKEYKKFLFFALYKNETSDMAIREFCCAYNIVRQKVANFAMLFLREFILSRNL